ncbi:MAG TPA: helix-turn-helix domain-containing protein [Dietzia sp.]|nr:helix-turn-helix domain-containing protein [Dietzia sp.]
MSSNLLPMRVLIKQITADWCDLAGIETDLRTIPVTDLDGRRADPMRRALREAETRARAAWAAEPVPPSTPAEWRDLYDRGVEALVDAVRAAALIYSEAALIYGGATRVPRQIDAIVRMAMNIAAVRRHERFADLVSSTEDAAEAFRAMRPSEHGKDRLTVPQVAQHLGLSVRTVQDYRLDGRLPEPTMIGRTPTWTREQIDEWQDNRPGSGRWGKRGREEGDGS